MLAAVGLEPGPALGPDEHGPVVRREDRLHVGCRVGRHLLRRAPGDRNDPDVVVRGPGLAVVSFTIGNKSDLATVGRPRECIDEMRETYKRRRDVLVESFGRAGWEVPPPAASMFAWSPLPDPFKTLGSVEFSKLLVEKAEVAVSPGTGFGERGEGYVRIALVENEQRIRQAARNIRRFLETAPEKLHNVVPLAKRG